MKKVVVSGMLGNGLEWYDFALYGQMAAIIGKLFFPAEDQFTQMLAAFGAFAVGFVFRPVGAVLFGYIGDHYGRRTSLVIAILMMAIPTGCIGILPTYEQIGILAPVLLTVIRIFQGLSLGGEFSGSITYIVEHAPQNRRGWAGAASLSSLVLGFMLGNVTAMAFVYALPTEDFESWGWRIPFLLGVVIGLVGLYIRSSCPESPMYETAKAEGHLSPSPLRDAFAHHWRQMLQAFCIYLTVTVPFYITSIYLISYTKLQLMRSAQEALSANFCAMLAMLIGILFGAWYSDIVGRKKVLVSAAFVLLASAYPLFTLMNGGDFTTIALTQVLLGLIVGVYIGPVAAVLVELFPTGVRYTGMAVSYNCSAAIFGGTAPMVAVWLINATGNTLSVAWYVMICCIVSLISLSVYRERFKDSII